MGLPKSNFVVREYIHDPTSKINIRDITWIAQGGTRSGDHINILGNLEMLEDVVRMATIGAPQSEDDQLPSELEWVPKRRVSSKLPEIAKKVAWPPTAKS